jgi:asparagine synthase (glutamine-hydrolysing)
MCGIFGTTGIMPKETKIGHRGPDNTHNLKVDKWNLVFHRLAINDLSENGDQPMQKEGITLLCNGEIYNCKELIEKYALHMNSHSDCEVIIDLYRLFGIEKCCQLLDGYFAFCLIDGNKVYLARDFVGVRPLFYSNSPQSFASEAKALSASGNVSPFPPGYYMEFGREPVRYKDNKFNSKVAPDTKIIERLFDLSVKKRTMSDREIGAFLSGGLDSSAVVAYLVKYLKEFTCFTVAVEDSTDNEDIKHAKMLIEYLNKKHSANIKLQVIRFTFEDIFKVIPELIYTLESYDTTTIRASVCQYLLSKWISENTNIRVIYSGEGSDEILCGYKMFRAAPNPNELQLESEKLVRELHLYDCLRTDRTTAAFGLEVRCPFLDNEFVDYVMNINPKYKMYTPDRMEKWIFRKAVEDSMPYEVCWRPKEAFSDSVSGKITLREYLQDRINSLIKDNVLQELYNYDLENNHFNDYNYHLEIYEIRKNPPKTKEEYYYRKIFNKYYPKFNNHLSHYWMPPSRWFNEALDDPSATILKV